MIPALPGIGTPNYNPQYRTISAEFEAFPGLTLPADLAPTPVAVAVQIPGTQTITPVSCTLNDMTGAIPATNPEFFAINKPYMYTNSDTAQPNIYDHRSWLWRTPQGTVTIGYYDYDDQSPGAIARSHLQCRPGELSAPVHTS